LWDHGQSCKASVAPRARKELSSFARKLACEHRALFASDPVYRKRAGQFLTALLTPNRVAAGGRGGQT
jgi:hypothetical protein